MATIAGEKKQEKKIRFYWLGVENHIELMGFLFKNRNFIFFVSIEWSVQIHPNVAHQNYKWKKKKKQLFLCNDRS